MSEEIERQLLAVIQAQAARDARLTEVLERLERRLASVEQDLLTDEQAMERIGCGRSKLFELARDGKIRKVKHGRGVRFTAESVAALNGVHRARR